MRRFHGEIFLKLSDGTYELAYGVDADTQREVRDGLGKRSARLLQDCVILYRQSGKEVYGVPAEIEAESGVCEVIVLHNLPMPERSFEPVRYVPSERDGRELPTGRQLYNGSDACRGSRVHGRYVLSHG